MSRASRGPWTFDERIVLGAGGIPSTDAERQERTARAILERFAHRPGVVLADEVGMGKTFVALAVAVSAALASEAPVVVMVPPRLMDKWEGDVRRFEEKCLQGAQGPGSKTVIRLRRARKGVEFLACFDDPPDRRNHIVLLANTALHSGERDPFARLQAMREAVRRHPLKRGTLAALPNFARELLRSSSLHGWTPDQIEALLRSEASEWLSIARGFGHELDDDPVPVAFLEALEHVDLLPLAEALALAPRRRSLHLEERISLARAALNDALKGLWSAALRSASIRSPLLVVDEAHHLKNPSTRLASLFADPESEDTSVISGSFDRMLFLTATPFQLGHHELLEVLSRFLAVNADALPAGTSVERLRAELEGLRVALDRAQQAAVQLDRKWGELRSEEVEGLALHESGSWARLRKDSSLVPSPAIQGVLDQYERSHEALRAAEVVLKPWVVRHLRDRYLRVGERVIPRRSTIHGRGIEDGLDSATGLTIPTESRFPFLLCARAQSVLARQSKTRAYFAEGIASSFEAFRDTADRGRPTDDPDVELSQGSATGEIAWYIDSVKSCLGEDPGAHPKIEATVRRVIREWNAGSKVLVFAHYIRTIQALTARLNEAVEQSVGDIAIRGFGLGLADRDEALARVQRIVARLQDRESPLRREVRAVVTQWTDASSGFSPGQREKVVDVLLQTLATRDFVVRNLPLNDEDLRASLESDRATVAQARAAADAVARSLGTRRGSRLAFRDRVKSFLEFLNGALGSVAERDQVLADLEAADKDVVRHATGEVREETRRRLLRGFNSPLLPEILVASEVMSEGVDLHLDCRHVIHHDLSWNPSTLEQRTGRIDRLRCLAEKEGESIHVYLPYLEGTADEKMFRVVTDRARWFQVVMGEKYAVDEHSTERLAERVPFPEEAAVGLAFDLAVPSA